MQMAPHILLVEDEAPVREMVAEYLRGRGAEVEEAGTLEDAQALLGDGHWDLLLADLRLPDGDGIELIRAASSMRPPIACVALSGITTADAAINVMRAGALDYLLKPVRLREVYVLVERAIREHKEREQRRWAADALELLTRAELASTLEEARACLPLLRGLLGRMPGSVRVEILDAGAEFPESRARPLGPHHLLLLDPPLPAALPVVLAVSRALDRCPA